MNAMADLAIRELEVAGAAGPLAARLYAAAGVRGKKDTLVVFFHGGGFVAGDLDEADEFLRRMSTAACGGANQLVLASRYTLATERPFPAAVEDAHAVLKWAKKNKAKLGWNGTHLVVAGIEAGANLAAVCALMSRDRGGPDLAAQILIMPMLDPGLTTCSMREVKLDDAMASVADKCAASYRDYLPNGADRTHPYASPLESSLLVSGPLVSGPPVSGPLVSGPPSSRDVCAAVPVTPCWRGRSRRAAGRARASPRGLDRWRSTRPGQPPAPRSRRPGMR